MKRCTPLLLSVFVTLAAAACSKEGAAPNPQGSASAPATAPGAAAKTAADDHLVKIPILPGYKYYAGGPRMKADAYGRYRISGFTGEVQQPPSRGMIFAAKVDGDQMEYRVWGNGTLLGFHKGLMRDGVFWQTYAEGYRDGKLVARETDVNDDESKHSSVTTEDIDPDNGEVIRTQKASLSYLPPEMPKEVDVTDDDEDSEDSKDVPAVSPPAAAAPAAATPPAAAAPGAGK